MPSACDRGEVEFLEVDADVYEARANHVSFLCFAFLRNLARRDGASSLSGIPRLQQPHGGWPPSATD
jgi:hypothetical protein